MPSSLVVISGGQTGIDQMALSVAQLMGLMTGGTAAKGYMTEDGFNLSLHKQYGLSECALPGYPARTEANVKNSEGTVWYGHTNNSTGYGCTKREAARYRRPFIENPLPRTFAQWVLKNGIFVLNVAGNRGSVLKLGDIDGYARQLAAGLKMVEWLRGC